MLQTWLDMKNDVKKKYQLQRKNVNQTGASPIDLTFSPLEERISQICNKQLLDGDENIAEIGFSRPIEPKSVGEWKFVIGLFGLCKQFNRN